MGGDDGAPELPQDNDQLKAIALVQLEQELVDVACQDFWVYRADLDVQRAYRLDAHLLRRVIDELAHPGLIRE